MVLHDGAKSLLRRRLYGRASPFLAVMALLLALLVPSVSAFGITGTMEFSAGYNDNPEEVEDGRGSTFARYSLSVDRSFFFSPLGAYADVSVSGAYQAYARLEDNYGAGVSAELVRPWFNGVLLPSLTCEVGILRDELVEEDERNEFAVGAGITWAVNRYMELTVDRSWKWLDYRHETRPFSGRGAGHLSSGPGRQTSGLRSTTAAVSPGYGESSPGGWGGQHEGGKGEGGEDSGGQGCGQPGGQCDGAGQEPLRRDDRLETTGVVWSLFPGSDITCAFSADYLRLYSSSHLEAFRQVRLGVQTAWEPARSWSIGLGFDWFRTEYDKGPRNTERTDYARHAALGISRFFGSYEVFVVVDWFENDSPVESESYTETVTQCGLAWSF
jgi:hypothetical protein